MRTGKGNHEEEEYDDEEFSSKKEGPSSIHPPTPVNNSNKDSKTNDKANATRSKHSVTEQRRRSKINERFQILRDLIPHSDQKRDTASFLLEVIEYVQYLQERVQKCEGSYQGWSSEPTKLMPWRNSHWRVQSFGNHPEATNGSALGPTFSGKIEENNTAIAPTMLTSTQTTFESEPNRVIDRQPELAIKGIPLPLPLQSKMPVSTQGNYLPTHPLQRLVSDAQLNDCAVTSDSQSQQEDLAIEGGRISISSAYSQGLLNTLTEALQSAGVDLSQANISVQIDLGKRDSKRPSSEPANAKDPTNQGMTHHRERNGGEGSDQAQKRLKT